MRKRDVVIRIRGGRFDEADAELLAHAIHVWSRVVENANPGQRVRFVSSTPTTIRLSLSRITTPPRTSAT